MKQSHGWMKWMSALVLSVGAAACGTVVSEPITLDSAGQPATSVIDPMKQVKDLSPDEARSWCTAYVNGLVEQITGGPVAGSPCGDPVRIKDGFASDGQYGSCGSIQCGSEPWLCIVVPSIDLCIKNLGLYPCDATLSELNACVDSIRDLNTPVCGGGCGPFRSHPSCVETVVHKYDYFENIGATCRLAVE